MMEFKRKWRDNENKKREKLDKIFYIKNSKHQTIKNRNI